MTKEIGHDTKHLMELAGCATVEELSKKHFFVQMEGVDPTLFCLMGIGIGVSNGKRTWRECFIDESRYNLADGYKLTLRALDNSNGYEHYYTSDFCSHVEAGYAFVKKDERDHIQYGVRFMEPLMPGVYVVHQGDMLVLND